MNTKEILDLALQLAGMAEVPGDTGILVEGENIKRVLIGVDMGTAEILLARQLGVDLVIGHHPVGGTTRSQFPEVMKRQYDKMIEAGLPINRAQKALAKKIGQVERAGHAGNYDQAWSAARLLNMPFMGIHSPTDVLAERAVEAKLEEALKDKPRATLQDILDALNEMPEYQKTLSKPVIRVGSAGDFAGKPVVIMAGGTNGGVDVIKAYFDAGIGTTVSMHMPEDVITAVKEQNIGNIVVAGHMASDSIGLNVFIKALQERGLEVIRMSGIIDPS
jgi:putative NIF3 family GTP cyclohydrolase 1 type 2